jgi:subtilisin family serine protease
VLATFLCAAPLLAAPAQASVDLLEREGLREALRHAGAGRAASNGVIRLPLPEAARASASSRTGELARIARSEGPERLLVGVLAHSQLPGVAAKLRALGGQTDSFETIGVVAARVPSGAAAVAALRGDRRVAYLERDRVLWAAQDEFDRPDPDAANLKFTWAYDAVRAGEALAAVGGGSARTIAVIDTGLDVNHAEFAGQVAQAFDTASGGSDVTDVVGHGTFVSGLIAALDGNGNGGKGVAGSTKLLAVRASRDGEFTISDLIRGIEFAIGRGADVLNMSLAGEGFTESHARALLAAFYNDVLPVAASGNNALNGNPFEFPAAAIGGDRGARGIGLSVAATKPDGTIAEFSNHNRFVSLAAPGASASDCRFGVFSTLPANTGTVWDDPTDPCTRVIAGSGGFRYAYGEGTSFAAPIVSGLAALAWHAERRLASEQVADVLMRSAVGSGWNEFTGAGVADAMAAVELARRYDVLAPRARGRTRRRGNRVRVRVTRTPDRTAAGDELARRVTYALLLSRDGARSFRVITPPRRRPISRRVTLRGRRINVLIGTACDGNGNCDVKRLGRFRRRR